MGIGAAIIGGAVIGGVSANVAANKSASAIKSSTNSQIAATERSEQRARADLAPFRQYGQNAMGQEFEQSPGYAWARQQGLQGIDNSFAARGSGGNHLKALTEFGTGLAQQNHNNWKSQNFNDIALGQNAAAGQATASMQSGMAQGNAYANQGANLASNAWNRYSGINNSLQPGLLGNYLYGKESGLIGNNVNQGPFAGNPGTPNGFEWGK